MSEWVAVVIGLVSGLASGLLGTLLTISHQRNAEFRSRMLRAAEDFLVTAEHFRRRIRHPDQPPLEALRSLGPAWDDLIPAVTLIDLLYGADSQPAHYARCTANEFSDIPEALARVVSGEKRDMSEVERLLGRAIAEMGAFGRAAALDVRQGWFRRRPRAIRWRLRRMREERAARRSPS